MTRDERVEEFVERELARASEVEPVAGLEDRLIARLRAAEPVAQRHVRPSWWWAGGSVLAAVAAIVLAVFAGRQPSTPPPPAATQSASAVTPSGSRADRVKPPEQPPASSPESGKAPSRPRETARASQPRPPTPGARTPNHASPRLVVFPSTAPLSSQERLLLALASRPEEAIAFAEEQQRPMTPLEIPEIVLEPLGEDQNSESRIRNSEFGS